MSARVPLRAPLLLAHVLAHAWACGLAFTLAACAPSGPGVRLTREPSTSPCARADAGSDAPNADAPLLDAPRLREDAPMSAEPFAIEPSTARVQVHAGERAVVPLRLQRASGHTAYIEVKASGLPPHVYGTLAIGADATSLALVIEAADTARAVSDTPFTLEAHAEGVRISRRMLLEVLAERAVPEE